MDQLVFTGELTEGPSQVVDVVILTLTLGPHTSGEEVMMMMTTEEQPGDHLLTIKPSPAYNEAFKYLRSFLNHNQIFQSP